MVTSLYAGILALIFIMLSVHVVRGRRIFRIAMGDNQNIHMLRRIRAHANFTEYSLFFLLLMGYTELNHLPHYILHALGVLFVAGRLSHAYSLLQSEEYAEGRILAKPLWRIRGIIISFFCIGSLAVISIIQFLTLWF